MISIESPTRAVLVDGERVGFIAQNREGIYEFEVMAYCGAFRLSSEKLAIIGKQLEELNGNV